MKRPITCLHSLILILLITGSGQPIRSKSQDGWKYCGRLGCEIVPYPKDYWTRYCNGRFGYCSDIPPGFAQRPSPASGIGLGFTHPDGSTLVVTGMHNSSSHSPATGLKEMVSDARRFAFQPIYMDKGSNWSVVSGFRNEKPSRIYYWMEFYSSGIVASFKLEFPASRKKYYEPIIRRLVDKFKDPKGLVRSKGIRWISLWLRLFALHNRKCTSSGRNAQTGDELSSLISSTIWVNDQQHKKPTLGRVWMVWVVLSGDQWRLLIATCLVDFRLIYMDGTVHTNPEMVGKWP